MVHPMALANDATEFLGDARLSTPRHRSDLADVPEGRKPFALVGSSLTAVFAAGVTLLAITMAINVQPTSDRSPDGARGASERCRAASPVRECRIPPRRSRPPRRSPLPRHHHCGQCHGTAEGSAGPAAATGIGAATQRPPRRRHHPRQPRPPFVVPPAVIAPPLIQWLPTDSSATPFFGPGPRGAWATAVATVAGGMGTAVVQSGKSSGLPFQPSRRIAVGNGRGDRSAQRASGHSPSSDVVSMMRPSATQAAP